MSKTADTPSQERSLFSELDDDFMEIKSRLEDIGALNAAMYSILDRLLEHDKAKSDTDILCSLTGIQERIISTVDEKLIAFWNKVPLGGGIK